MGKKSRRNKKTENDAASATASATATTSATAANGAGSGTNLCLHGSTADKFQPNGEYMKAAEEYLDIRHQVALLDDQVSSQAQQLIPVRLQTKYMEDYMHLMKDPEFCRFIFALCTIQYLEFNNLNKADGDERQMVQTLLTLGLMCRDYSTDDDKLPKYLRDSMTERGIIKILARETATHCDCMNEGKGIAKTMDTIGRCYGCQKEFPKMTLRFCNGCQYVKYHNRECQINHRPLHRLECKCFNKIETRKINNQIASKLVSN